MLENLFKLKENKTTVSKEFIAGLTTFITMSYALFIIPSILSQTGMDYQAVYGATILASVIGTLILGVFANVPYAQCAGIGLASLVTYTICGTLGYTWQQALAMIFICSIINLIITFTKIRKKIIKSIPVFLQEAITVGIGLFIAYIGLVDAGIISFGASSITNGIANDVVPQLSAFSTRSVILALIGIIITIILVVRKVKGAYLISILATTIIGIPMGVTGIPDFSNYAIVPDISLTFLHLDLIGLFNVKSSILVILMTIFTLCISDLFDTIGVFIGTGKKSGIFKVDEDGHMPEKLEKAVMADAFGSFFASLLGTSNVTTYIESSSGIEAGGRTGLTSVFTAILLLLSLVLAPLIKCVPMAAVAPVLIIVGASMLENIGNIDFKDLAIGIPAFFVIAMIPLGYSISTGIQFGFIAYTITGLVTRKGKEISPVVYIFSLLFILQYVFNVLL
jgi:AGZA family xanthine/uracil permease-like MFS transporter